MEGSEYMILTPSDTIGTDKKIGGTEALYDQVDFVRTPDQCIISLSDSDGDFPLAI